MAMTKKERAAFDAALHTARVAGALRWTEGPPRDIRPPQTGIVNGWDFNAPSQVVTKACTGPVTHSFGNWDRTTTQGCRSLYSTRERALRALRAELEKRFATDLAIIDHAIAEETRLSGSAPEERK